MGNKTDNFGFVEVRNDYWVPEKAGEVRTGFLASFETTETVHGEADVAVLLDFETHEEFRIVVGGGLQNLLRTNLHSLCRITYEGEKENPNPKKGRSKMFKAYKLEVATKYGEDEYNAWVLGA